jgi:hypothetical protein
MMVSRSIACGNRCFHLSVDENRPHMASQPISIYGKISGNEESPKNPGLTGRYVGNSYVSRHSKLNYPLSNYQKRN